MSRGHEERIGWRQGISGLGLKAVASSKISPRRGPNAGQTWKVMMYVFHGDTCDDGSEQHVDIDDTVQVMSLETQQH